jgi:DNA-binding CsgD family transcriptional regulator
VLTGGYDAAGMPPAHAPLRPARFVAGGLILLALWVTVAGVLLYRETFTDGGPLSLRQPPLLEPLPGGPGPDPVLATCFPERSAHMQYQVVGGRVDGRLLYGCYELDPEGTVPRAKVVDQYGHLVTDVGAVKRGGAWPWLGMLNSPGDLLWGTVGIATLLVLLGVVYERERPLPAAADEPVWTRPPLLWLLLAVPVAGWLTLLALPGSTAARRWWLLRRVSLVALGIVAAFPAILLEWRVDAPGVAAALAPIAAFAYGVAAGRRWLAPGAAAEPATTMIAPPPPAPPRPPDLAGGSLDPAFAELTSRELEVLRHLAMGRSNAEIAKALFVSEATVKTHVARMLSKLGLSNRVQAARYAYQHGLPDDPAV